MKKSLVSDLQHKNGARKIGFTFIEMMVVIAIIAILSVLSLVSFVSVNKKGAVEKTALMIISVIDEARSITLASKNSSQYGVHFENSQVVLFAGGSYSASDPDNEVYPFSNNTTISSINLSGGGSDIIFERLTGKVSTTGTVTVSFSSDSSINKTITIYGTGIAK